MKKLLLTTIILLPIFLLSCSVEELVNIPEEYNIENENIEYIQLDYDIALLINEHRSALGIAELAIMDEVSIQATSHSVYMVNKGEASHDYFYIRSANLKENVNAKQVSENIGYGFSNANTIVLAWLNSVEHRKNIENPYFTHLGISTKTDLNNRKYTTNIFIRQ
jgi:uncharacterized protein YkwD